MPRALAAPAPAAAVEDACASVEDAVASDALSELPSALLSFVLRALLASDGAGAGASAGAARDRDRDAGPRALLRLAACSQHLARAVAAAQDAWQVGRKRTQKRAKMLTRTRA
jgi:hypothetical protein